MTVCQLTVTVASILVDGNFLQQLEIAASMTVTAASMICADISL
jgi:hypothetical protein